MKIEKYISGDITTLSTKRIYDIFHKSEKILNKECRKGYLSDITVKGANEILDNLDTVQMDLRSVLQVYETDNKIARCNDYEHAIIDNTEVTFNDGILKVFVPLTLQRTYSRKKYIAISVALAITEYQQKTCTEIRTEIKPPYCTLITRNVHRITHKVYDNNNEDSTIMNYLMANLLNHTDAPGTLKTHVHSVKEVPIDSPEGTEFTIFPPEKWKNVLQNAFI